MFKTLFYVLGDLGIFVLGQDLKIAAKRQVHQITSECDSELLLSSWSDVQTSHFPVWMLARKKRYGYLKPALSQLSTSLRNMIFRASIESIKRQAPRPWYDTTQGSWVVSSVCSCKNSWNGFKPTCCDCIIYAITEVYQWGSVRSSFAKDRPRRELEFTDVRSTSSNKLSW